MTIKGPRDLPKMDDLLKDPQLDSLKQTQGYLPVKEAVRSLLEAARQTLTGAEGPTHPDAVFLDQVRGIGRDEDTKIPLSRQSLLEASRLKLESEARPGIRKVINATGAILHTNLGRAPLAEQALAALAECSRGYASLEFDLKEGKRGQRTSSVEALLCRLFGVEAATVVNNNAAAVILALSALCRGRQVLVSRSELVEIGGKFRVPEIMEESGALLREVGTTNKTYLADYEKAIDDSTGALLKVHRSNFRISGFTEDVDEADLARLAHQHGLPLIYDLGSGCVSTELADLLPGEPTVADALASGADVICFSGDKLLGGPQAGIILGRAALIGKMAAHPLMRAFRCDKLALSALEATLTLYRDPDRAKQHVPLLKSALYDSKKLRERTKKLAASLAHHGIEARVVASQAIMGGGAAPEIPVASWALAIKPEPLPVSSLESALLSHDPPILCRTTHETLLFDLRTLSGPDEDLLLTALLHIFNREVPLP